MGPQFYGFLLLITLMSILMACVRTVAKNTFPFSTAQKMNRCVYYMYGYMYLPGRQIALQIDSIVWQVIIIG